MSWKMRKQCVSVRWYIKLQVVLTAQLAVVPWQHNFAQSLIHTQH